MQMLKVPTWSLVLNQTPERETTYLNRVGLESSMPHPGSWQAPLTSPYISVCEQPVYCLRLYTFAVNHRLLGGRLQTIYYIRMHTYEKESAHIISRQFFEAVNAIQTLKISARTTTFMWHSQCECVAVKRSVVVQILRSMVQAVRNQCKAANRNACVVEG